MAVATGVEEVLGEQLGAADDEEHQADREREGAEDPRRAGPEVGRGETLRDAERHDAEHDGHARDGGGRELLERRHRQPTPALTLRGVVDLLRVRRDSHAHPLPR
jgi:hypothetical protein